jgi:hypothetical protein
VESVNLIIPSRSRVAERVLSNQGIYIERTAFDLPLKRTETGKYRYPLRTMLPGQHFYVPAEGRSVVQTQNSVSSSVCHIQRETGRKFHQRRYMRGVRVWRTK